MKKRTIALALATLFAVAVVCVAADDPFTGTWKVNEAKTHIPPGERKDTTDVYSIVGDTLEVTADGINPNGERSRLIWKGKLDGKDYPMTGTTFINALTSFTRIDDRTIWEIDKHDGKVISTAVMVVSADGKSRTVMRTSTGANGNVLTSIRVYDKQ
jgi:hypothetical protein